MQLSLGIYTYIYICYKGADLAVFLSSVSLRDSSPPQKILHSIAMQPNNNGMQLFEAVFSNLPSPRQHCALPKRASVLYIHVAAALPCINNNKAAIAGCWCECF